MLNKGKQLVERNLSSCNVILQVRELKEQNWHFASTCGQSNELYAHNHGQCSIAHLRIARMPIDIHDDVALALYYTE